EKRVFQVKWEVDYLFTEFKGKPMCLVCLETLSAMKDFNLSCHYNTLHKVKYEKYTEAARTALIADLKSKVHKQQQFFTRATTTQEAALMPSIFDINDHVEGKMKEVMHNCKYFSLALDDSTDVMDVSQLLRTVDRSVEVHEELLKMVPTMPPRARIYSTQCNSVANAYGGLDKLSAVVTDGAPAMQGRRTGFAGLLQQSGVNCPIMHCIIHQEALCAKKLNFNHLTDLVTKVTHLIREGNRSLSHRRCGRRIWGFTNAHLVRWISRGKCLERFFALRSQIPVFLGDSVRGDMSANCRKLKDTAFLCDMAFLTDITAHLNDLNPKLQGRDQTVCDLCAHINAFQRKLDLFSHLPNLTYFPACEEMGKSVPECEGVLHKYKTDIEKLQEQFKHSFLDFHAMQPQIALFVDPLSAAVSEQPSELQLELCDLQSDPFFQARCNEKGITFWGLLPECRFPLLRDFALSMTSMFGSTYICESSFSTMK
uniref:SPIN-DOC-like zinc-finger domain-containing protein n=1 Tax=Gasterosteus aculeatus TaxID=69293 RepID=G3NBB9_GASAC